MSTQISLETRAQKAIAAVNDAAVVQDAFGATVVGLQITGTFTATVVFEASIDGTTFFSVLGTPYAGGAAVSSATAPGNWILYVPGACKVRARCSAFTVATVPLVATLNGGVSAGAVTFGAGGGSTVDTELPAAALAADNMALPTAPEVLAVNQIYDGATLDLWRAANAAQATSGDGIGAAGQMAFDPFDNNWKRRETNAASTILNVAAVTATQTGPTFENRNYQGVGVTWRITAVSGTGTDTLQLILAQRDVLAGNFHTVFTDAAYPASGGVANFSYLFSPGCDNSPSAGATGYRAVFATRPFRQYRFQVIHAGVGTWTYNMAGNALMGA